MRRQLRATCPRYRKTSDTPDLSHLPDHPTAEEVEALPECYGVTYEECGGTVSGLWTYFPATWGDYGGSPEENDVEWDKCDGCGNDEWTDEEEERFSEARYE